MGLHCPQRDFYLVEIVGYVSTLALLKGSRRKTMVASSVNSLSLSQICGDALGSALSLSNKVSLIPVTVRPRTLFTPLSTMAKVCLSANIAILRVGKVFDTLSGGSIFSVSDLFSEFTQVTTTRTSCLLF